MNSQYPAPGRLFGTSLILLILFAVCCFAKDMDNKSRAYYDLGVFAFEDKDYAGAQKMFEKSLELTPDQPEAMQFLGKTYLATDTLLSARKYLTQAYDKEPDLPDLKLDLAFLYYKMAEYDKSADMFEKAIKANPSDVKALYHAGIAFYQAQRYKGAIKWLQSAIEKSPNIKPNAYYYIGICYLKLDMIDHAKSHLTFVKDNAKNDSLVEYASKALNGIKQFERSHKRYSLYCKVGYQYDSNVTLEPVDIDYATDEKDFVTKLLASGSYTLIDWDRFDFDLRYTHYQTFHNSLHEYDIRGSIGTISSRFDFYPVELGIAYLPSYFYLEHDDFLRRHQIQTYVQWNATHHLSFQLTYNFYNNTYFTDEDKNANAHEGLLETRYRLDNIRGMISTQIGYERNDAKTDVDSYDQYAGNIIFLSKIPADITLRLNVDYEYKQYLGDRVDNASNVFTRKDGQIDVTLSLSHKLFFDPLNIEVEGGYLKNESTDSNYDYNSKTVGMYLSVNY